MGKLYMATTGAMPTTAATGTVATLATSSPKTLIQIKTATTTPIRVCEWGISFDGTTVLTPLKCELLEVDTSAGSNNATITAYVASGLFAYNDPNAPATTVQIGSTTNSGYNSTSENMTSATVRVLDVAYVSPTGFYVHQFPLGREPEVKAGRSLRVRVTDSGTAINAYAYVIWEE